jgi:hypothetical protein
MGRSAFYVAQTSIIIKLLSYQKTKNEKRAFYFPIAQLLLGLMLKLEHLGGCILPSYLGFGCFLASSDDLLHCLFHI